MIGVLCVCFCLSCGVCSGTCKECGNSSHKTTTTTTATIPACAHIAVAAATSFGELHQLEQLLRARTQIQMTAVKITNDHSYNSKWLSHNRVELGALDIPIVLIVSKQMAIWLMNGWLNATAAVSAATNLGQRVLHFFVILLRSLLTICSASTRHRIAPHRAIKQHIAFKLNDEFEYISINLSCSAK